jgi:hypothetical protein
MLPHDKWIIIIAIIVLISAYYASGSLLMAPMLAVVVQFFLFCNIFRVRTSLEMVWAFLFTPVTVIVLWMGWSPWFVPMVLWSVGAILILVSTKDSLYCGLGWKGLNPDLEKNWNQRRK